MACSWLMAFLCGVAFAANHAPPYDNAWCWEARPCSDNNQCKQPNGVNGVCCLGMCRNFKLSRGELCGASLPNSACPSCDDNLKCVDVGNGQNKCEQQNVANGCLCNSTSKSCISTQPCLPSGFCGAKDVAPGGRCEVNSQCYPNSICNGTTCQPIKDGDGCGSPNILSNLCLVGSVCAADSKCSVAAQFNQACNADYECAQPDLWCTSAKKCANRTGLGMNCTGTSCVVGSVCSSGTCVTPRTVANNADCTQADACISGICAGGQCTATHFATVGQDCNADLDCSFGATCQTKKCTASGLGLSCDPTLGGGDMDKQCQGSNDLYCSCAGRCLPTDAAILPASGTATSDCQAAKDLISKFKLGDLKKIDVASLTNDQRTAIATDQCCRNCNKDDRVSKVGALINCVTKSISQPTYDACGLFSTDPVALSNCPTRTTSDATMLNPIAGVLSVFLFVSQLQ